MGRSWFPLALFGFGLLAMVGFTIGSSPLWDFGPYSAADGGFQLVTGNLQMGTGGVGGTGYVTAVAPASGWSPLWSWGPGIHAASTAWLVVNIGGYLGTLIHYARRDRRLRGGRLVALVLGGPVAIVLVDLTVYGELKLDGDVRGPLLATVGLLGLAWLERSRLVLVVAVAFALADVVLLAGAAGALLGAAILFAGAFAVLLRRRPSATVDNGPGEH